MHPPAFFYTWCYASLFAWLGAFALSGWVNSGRPDIEVANKFRYYANRVWQSLAAVLLCPLTVTWTSVALVIAYFMGNPRSFEVIEKTAPSPRKPAPVLRKKAPSSRKKVSV